MSTPVHLVALRTATAVAALLTLCLAAPTASAQCTLNEQVFVQDLDGRLQDYFGRALDLNDERMVVGAPSADMDPNDRFCESGAVYVFRHDGLVWQEETILTASDEACGAAFGDRVALDGEALLVGAPTASPAARKSGGAYLFRFNGSGWKEEQLFVPSDAAARDHFGFDVALDGDLAVVGAPKADTAAGSAVGAVYVFRRVAGVWTEEARLQASDGAAGDHLGGRVAVGPDLVLGAADRADPAGKDSGAVYAWRFDGSQWNEEAKLVPAAANVNDLFGSAIELSGDLAAIGAKQHATRGAVYLYRSTVGGWIEEDIVLASDRSDNRWFGDDVGLDGNSLVVGATLDASNQPGFGSAHAYRFDGTQWEELWHLRPGDVHDEDHSYYGNAMAVSGETMAVGAFMARNEQERQAGGVYVFGPLSLVSSGNDLAAGDTLSLITRGGLPGGPAMLFVVDVDGTPVRLKLALGSFGRRCGWKHSGTVPPGLAGMSIGFEGVGIAESGIPAVSNVETVRFR